MYVELWKQSGEGINMVCACMRTAGVRKLCFIEENMDWYMCLDIPKQNILTSAENCLLVLNMVNTIHVNLCLTRGLFRLF